MEGAWGQLIGVMNREPAPPPPRNQQAATARMPPSAKSWAKRTYSWAKPWLPCRRRNGGVWASTGWMGNSDQKFPQLRRCNVEPLHRKPLCPGWCAGFRNNRHVASECSVWAGPQPVRKETLAPIARLPPKTVRAAWFPMLNLHGGKSQRWLRYAINPHVPSMSVAP